MCCFSSCPDRCPERCPDRRPCPDRCPDRRPCPCLDLAVANLVPFPVSIAVPIDHFALSLSVSRSSVAAPLLAVIIIQNFYKMASLHLRASHFNIKFCKCYRHTFWQNISMQNSPQNDRTTHSSSHFKPKILL